MASGCQKAVLLESVAISSAASRVGQVLVLNLEHVQVQQGDCLVGAVAVEALDSGPVALELIGVVPVAVYYQLRAGRLHHRGQQALLLRWRESH